MCEIKILKENLVNETNDNVLIEAYDSEYVGKLLKDNTGNTYMIIKENTEEYSFDKCKVDLSLEVLLKQSEEIIKTIVKWYFYDGIESFKAMKYLREYLK